MKKNLLLLIGLLFAIRLFAVPATPDTIQFTQPDGTQISLRLIGDEYFSMFVSLNDYPLIKSADGFFYYAVPDNNGEYVLSKYRATNEPVTDPMLKSILSKIQKRDVGDYLYKKIKEKREELYKLNTIKSLNSLNKTSTNPLEQQVATEVEAYSSQRRSTIASKKDFKGLVLVVEFTDQKLNKNYPFTVFDEMANQVGYTDYGFSGSVRDYFYDQSYGQFEPTFDVVGPISLPQNMEYYGGVDPATQARDKNVPELVVTACQIAKTQYGTDFSKYDQDNDGLVDMIYVIFAGYSQAQGANENTIWPHAWDVRYRAGTYTIDDKILATYACSSEMSFTEGDHINGIGTLVHEFSHILGLVDVYDVNYSGNYGMGSWDLMSGGNHNNFRKTPAGYSAYERQMVGWMELEELIGDQEVEMQYIGYTPQAYSITNTQNSDELFTLENRQQIKWDSYLSSKGLMIIHINYDPIKWGMNDVNTSAIQGYSIVPADNIQSIYNEPDDLYPNRLGNNSFSANSVPSSAFYDGSAADIELNDISLNGQDVEFSYTDGRAQTPDNIRFENISKSGLTMLWNEAPNCTSYEVRIQTKYTNPELLNEDFSKMSAGSISSPDSKDISPVLNQYVESDQLIGNKIFQAGGACAVGTDQEEGILVSPLMKYLGDEYVPTISFDVVNSKNTEWDNRLIFSYDQDLTHPFAYITFRDATGPFNFKDPAWTNRDLYVGFVGSKSFVVDNFSIIYDGSVVPNYTDKWQGEKGITKTSTYIPSLQGKTEYTVQVRGVNNGGVSEWSEPQFVSTNNSSTGIMDSDSDVETVIYSDGDQIVLELSRDCIITITNIMGQVVYKQSHPMSIVKIDLDKGIYMLDDGARRYKISH